MTKQNWPTQSHCDTFYGNPHGHDGHSSPEWEHENLVDFYPPWQMIDEDSKKLVQHFKIHKKCKDSLTRVFERIWEFYGKNQTVIENHHLHWFSGSYVFRSIRGSTRLSMHGYGVALDIASSLNEMGSPWDPHHGLPSQVIKEFEEEGWVWGGRWHGRPDAMHFQAAIVG
ncbi:MAG TPA: M15 family metallopeptidase [Methylomirabilota bacterium]|nr:M15 family metallopeptidase [Methylomirabilota bacterium]